MNYVVTLFKPPAKFRDWGAGYSPAWVNALLYNLKKHSPHCTLTVVTDFAGGFDEQIIVKGFTYEDSGWAKMMEMFRPDVVKERSILLGLDNVAIGDLSEIEAHAESHPLIVSRDPNKKGICNAVIALDAVYSEAVWKLWQKRKDFDLTRKKYFLKGQWSEMLWLRDKLGGYALWDVLVPNQIVSYKKHCKNGIPEKAKIVYFHGPPKQNNITQPWVTKNWKL